MTTLRTDDQKNDKPDNQKEKTLTGEPKKPEQEHNPTPKTARPDAPISTTSAADMPRQEKDLHLKTREKYEKQKWNDATSIPNSPIRQGETRDEENESEGEYDTGLNEPVPQGEPTKNIGKL